MRALFAVLPSTVLATALIACGGDGEGLITPKERAMAAEAQARSLLETSPCAADSQCGYVTFQTPYHSCSQGEHAPYLLTSPTAEAAGVLAESQRSWAQEALKLEPPPDFVCVASVEPMPIPICVQSQCSLKRGSFGPLTAPRS